MLYIQKKQEPSSLTAYRKMEFAYFDGYAKKDDVRKQLLEEQGHLCAYCMRRIDIEHMKIEHWYPEDRLTESERLDYRNMLGVCEGHMEGSKGSDDTCDAHKGNSVIVVNPLDKSTIVEIEYSSSDGRIYSKNKDIDMDLDKTLNLHSEKHMLALNRKAALDSAIREMSRQMPRGTWTRKHLERTLNYYQNADAEGRKKEYAGIVVWYLMKKLRRV